MDLLFLIQKTTFLVFCAHIFSRFPSIPFTSFTSLLTVQVQQPKNNPGRWFLIQHCRFSHPKGPRKPTAQTVRVGIFLNAWMILFLCFAGELHVIIFVLTGVLAPVDCSGSILMVSQTQNLSRIETSLGSWSIDVPMLFCRFSSKNIHKTHKTAYPAFLRISQSLQGFHDKIGAKKNKVFLPFGDKTGTCYLEKLPRIHWIILNLDSTWIICFFPTSNSSFLVIKLHWKKKNHPRSAFGNALGPTKTLYITVDFVKVNRVPKLTHISIFCPLWTRVLATPKDMVDVRS